MSLSFEPVPVTRDDNIGLKSSSYRQALHWKKPSDDDAVNACPFCMGINRLTANADEGVIMPLLFTFLPSRRKDGLSRFFPILAFFSRLSDEMIL